MRNPEVHLVETNTSIGGRYVRKGCAPLDAVVGGGQDSILNRKETISTIYDVRLLVGWCFTDVVCRLGIAGENPNDRPCRFYVFKTYFFSRR